MLIAKLTVVPIIIALIAVVGRYWGPKVSGLLSGFPVIAGPITYFIYLDQGAEFARSAATATVAGVTALSSFCFSYAWFTTRFGWKISLVLALILYFVLAVTLKQLDLDLCWSFAISLITIALQILCSPGHRQIVGVTPASTIEIITRMVSAAMLVLLVTLFASVMGPAYSGIFAAFPIASTVIAVFSHRNHSSFHAMDALKALKYGLISLLAFFAVLAWMISHIGFNEAFVLAIISALAVQAIIWTIIRAKRRKIQRPV